MHPGYGADLHYTIVRETSFETKMQEFTENFSRLAELETALDWALARNPHSFNQLFNDIYFIVTEDLGEFGIPPLRVLYLIDSENRKVILLDVDLKE
jgi:hypothetical protein